MKVLASVSLAQLIVQLVGARKAVRDGIPYLGVSDRTRQGSLRFLVGDGPHLSDGTDVPKLVQLPELRQAAHDVENHTDNLSALKKLLDAGTGSLAVPAPSHPFRTVASWRSRNLAIQATSVR